MAYRYILKLLDDFMKHICNHYAPQRNFYKPCFKFMFIFTLEKLCKSQDHYIFCGLSGISTIYVSHFELHQNRNYKQNIRHILFFVCVLVMFINTSPGDAVVTCLALQLYVLAALLVSSAKNMRKIVYTIDVVAVDARTLPLLLWVLLLWYSIILIYLYKVGFGLSSFFIAKRRLINNHNILLYIQLYKHCTCQLYNATYQK